MGRMRTLTFHRVLGSGATGVVYQAELRVPRGFSRQCAVKVMKAAAPDQEEFCARMRDEARLLGMLRDEQILGVSELVRVLDRDAIVMDFVEGIDLAALSARHTAPPRALAELGAELAGALHRAHTARHPQTDAPLGIVHRDVKPANLMLTPRGGVRLLDFGVARAVFDTRESRTRGFVLGTLDYFPPEVLTGGEPEPAVDLYGLGLTLWECATGRAWGPPLTDRARYERRIERRLGELGPEYHQLLPVLRQLLAWDPAHRPDGGVIERALLHVAETCSGPGLRAWARQVVPGALWELRRHPPPDELVGREFPLDDEVPAEAPPGATEPSRVLLGCLVAACLGLAGALALAAALAGLLLVGA